MTWDPKQYDKFLQPRLRPALDLIGAIPDIDPAVVVDLGCGSGNITRLLAQQWPRASVTGIDDSEAMLAKAADEPGSIHWMTQSVADWGSLECADVVFSNAALHWLPDHATLFKRLVDALKPGGVLAVQMPRNFTAPSHTLIAETARGGPWRSKLASLLGPDPVAEPDFYHAVLSPLAQALDLWETQYFHLLEGPDPVKEWTKGSWLRRFLDRLDPHESAAFEQQYARALRAAYPPSADGRTWFPFKRLFIVLRK